MTHLPQPDPNILKRLRATAKNVHFNFVITRTGAVVAKPMMRMADKDTRERIIASQYLRLMDLWAEPDGPPLISRDTPVDFVYALPNGGKLSIEITSVSDVDRRFTQFSAQQMLDELLAAEPSNDSFFVVLPHRMSTQTVARAIPDLARLPTMEMPTEKWMREVLPTLEALRSPSIFRIHDGQGKRYYQLNSPPSDFKELVLSAINRKVAKHYQAPNEMVLIVDEQTTQHPIPEIQELWPDLIRATAEYPFKEIYVYSAIYSGADGLAAEFSLFTLKAPLDSDGYYNIAFVRDVLRVT